jgi:hypothetical protein
LIDVRPISERNDDVVVTESTYLHASAVELASRKSVLRALRIGEGDARLPAHCGGTEMPNPPAEDRVGCPPTKRRVAAIGRPRRGDVTTDSVVGATSLQRWSVAVIVADMGPYGLSYLKYEYVLEDRNGRWHVLKKKMVAWRE